LLLWCLFAAVVLVLDKLIKFYTATTTTITTIII